MFWKLAVCEGPLFTKLNLINHIPPSCNSFHNSVLRFYPRTGHVKVASHDPKVLNESTNQDKSPSLTDRLYEKYGYLFAESPSDDKEIIYKTSFGFVRLDSENALVSKPRLTKSKCDESLTNINDSEGALPSCNEPSRKGQNKILNRQEVNSSKSDAADTSSSKDNDLNNYIDELYFPAVQKNSVNSDVKVGDELCIQSLHTKTEESKSNVDGSDSNADLRHSYIDEMYFTTSMHNSENLGSEIMKNSQFKKQPHTEIFKSDLQCVDQLESIETHNDLYTHDGELENNPLPTEHFIDENFFPSLFKDHSKPDDATQQSTESGMKKNASEFQGLLHDLKQTKVEDTAITSKVGSSRHKILNLESNTRHEILNILKKSVIYNKDGIIVIDKPYGLKCQPDGILNDKLDLKSYLPKLSAYLNVQQLEIIHRLDKDTTGVMLLGADEDVTKRLKKAFKDKKVIKLYWLLAVGLPNPRSGIINIPIAEGIIGNKYRMVLHPIDNVRFSHKKSRAAVSHYKVLSEVGKMSLVEVRPVTGVKHQIRVHFGFGMGCPILGDHKYSHLNKLAPQRLPDYLLRKLSLSQAQVRSLPIHLHAKQIIIPQFLNGSDLHVSAGLPSYFYKITKKLGFNLKSIKSKDHLSLEATDNNTLL